MGSCQNCAKVLAETIHISPRRLRDMLHGHGRVSPGLALRLAQFWGTSPDFWLNLQLRCDLYNARQAEQAVLITIRPYPQEADRALQTV